MKTIEEVRRERLNELKGKYGSFAAINKILDRPANDSTLSQIANQSVGSKTDKPKTMGSMQARSLEAALDLERGWMDTDPALVSAVRDSWPFPGISFDRFQQLSIEQRLEIQGAVRMMMDRFLS